MEQRNEGTTVPFAFIAGAPEKGKRGMWESNVKASVCVISESKGKELGLMRRKVSLKKKKGGGREDSPTRRPSGQPAWTGRAGNRGRIRHS